MAWTLRHPSVVSSLIGARTPEQLQQNISALDVTFDEYQLDTLHAASAVDLGFPHEFLMRPMVRGVTTGHGETPFHQDLVNRNHCLGGDRKIMGSPSSTSVNPARSSTRREALFAR